MNAAELFVRCLEREGIRHIFGVPGEENEDLLFALAKSDIEFVPVRHEQGGAFIANVYGRLTGKAGVCLSTLGPGATNLITGVADAFLDKAPLVAITGQGGLERLHHGSHQIIDVVSMMKPITKWNSTIQDVSVIPEVVRKAFKIAEQEKPGAVHIELPEDIAGQNVDGNLYPLDSSIVRRPNPNPDAIQQVVQLIQSAEKPMILAGNGAIRNRASRALTDFATVFQIPVACTFMGKGAISDRSPLSLGAVGLGFKDYVIEAFEQADLVLAIGYDIAEYDPQGWNTGRPKKIIHLDFEPAEIFSDYIPDLEVIGDLAASIEAIHHSIEIDPFPAWYGTIRNRIFESIEQYQLQPRDPFHVPGVTHLVRKILPDHGLLISDVGTHKMWIARNFPTYCPNGCIISNGLASMGISLPGGIAAKIANPDRPVVCLMGDGGALMNIQELETAKRLNTGFTIIVLNDNNYGLIEWKQEQSKGKSTGTRIGNPDYVQLGKSFGIPSYKPDSIGALEQIITESLASNQLTLIEIPIDTDVNGELTRSLDAYFQNK